MTTQTTITRTLTCAALIAGVLISTGYAGWEANLPDPISTSSTYSAPYKYVGYLTRGGGSCSGSVIKHKRVILTAAHCLYDDDGDFNGLPRWFHRYHGTSKPDLDDGTELYGHRRYNDYVNRLKNGGAQNDKEAFNMDIATLFGFEDMASGGTAPYKSDGASLLKSISKDKRIVGYPTSLYDENSASPRPLPENAHNEYKMHSSSPVWHRYYKRTGTSYYYRAVGQAKGLAKLVGAPGNSGGPVFVKDGSTWKVAGVHVSGVNDHKIIDKSGSDDDKYSGRSGVRALTSGAISQLLDPLANAGDCNYTLTPSSRNHNWTGGTGSVNVKVGAGCSWYGSISHSDLSWVTITSAITGKGNGAISYELDPNPYTHTRTAKIVVKGEIFTIRQAGSERIDLRDRGSLNRALSHTERAPGQKLTIEADVANMGNIKSTKAFKVRYYASKNNTINPSKDIYLGQKTLGAIEKWKWANADRQVTLPSGMAGGNYYIGWRIDALNQIAEDNESNNTVVMGETVFIKRVDLRDAGGHKSLYNDVHPGHAVSFGGKIRCSGNAPSGTFKLMFFLSKIESNGGLTGGSGLFVGNGGGQPPAPEIEPGDRHIGTRHFSADANSTKEFNNVAFVLDTNFPQGNYRVKWAIDASNDVAETNENNNVVQVSGVVIKVLSTIDLRDRGAQHHGLSKTELGQGGSLTIRGDVLNGGNLGSGPYKVAFYASTDDQLDPEKDIKLGEKSMPGLFKGAHDDVDKTVQLPNAIAPGDYHIGWIIDPAGTATQNQGMVIVGNGGGSQTPKIELVNNNKVVMAQTLKVKHPDFVWNPGGGSDPIDDLKNPPADPDNGGGSEGKDNGGEAAPTSEPQISSIRLEKGQIVIRVATAKGTVLSLESSTTMSGKWTVLTTEQAEGGVHEFRDAKIGGEQKFYRVKASESAVRRRPLR